MIASDPELPPRWTILDGRIVKVARHSDRCPGHIDIAGAVHSNGVREIITGPRTVILHRPELLPIRIVLYRGEICLIANRRAEPGTPVVAFGGAFHVTSRVGGACHVHVACAVHRYCRGCIIESAGAIVETLPARRSSGVVHGCRIVTRTRTSAIAFVTEVATGPISRASQIQIVCAAQRERLAAGDRPEQISVHVVLLCAKRASQIDVARRIQSDCRGRAPVSKCSPELVTGGVVLE